MLSRRVVLKISTAFLQSRQGLLQQSARDTHLAQSRRQVEDRSRAYDSARKNGWQRSHPIRMNINGEDFQDAIATN